MGRIAGGFFQAFGVETDPREDLYAKDRPREIQRMLNRGLGRRGPGN
jgi:hypothetical protein